VTIFNRSHYEDVLVARVHDLVPKKTWSGGTAISTLSKKSWPTDGTPKILKFFLHISKMSKLRRFKQRLVDRTSNGILMRVTTGNANSGMST